MRPGCPMIFFTCSNTTQAGTKIWFCVGTTIAIKLILLLRITCLLSYFEFKGAINKWLAVFSFCIISLV
jgi:hypothetical protein